jgi:hypothetical protein
MTRNAFNQFRLGSLIAIAFTATLGGIACEVNVCSQDDEDCEVGSVGDSDDGGDSSAGSAGSAGSGNVDDQDDASPLSGPEGGASDVIALPELDCHEEGVVSGTLGDTSPTVEMTDRDYECQECAERLCEEQLAACYATGPDSVCLSGTTSLMEDSGEAGCMLACFLELGDELTLLDVDVNECAAQCGATECASESASSVTQDLMRCFLDTSETDSEELGCVAECGLDINL